MKHYFDEHGKNTNVNGIHKVSNLAMNSPMLRNPHIQQIGYMQHIAFIAMEELYNDLCVAHGDYASDTWETTLRF
eukprot:1125740-Karenia_brevis.AAC.1